MKRKKSSQSVKQSHLLFVLSSPFEDAGINGTEAARRDKEIKYTNCLENLDSMKPKYTLCLTPFQTPRNTKVKRLSQSSSVRNNKIGGNLL